MLRRAGRWLLELLIALDQLLHVLLGAPKFILIGGACPSADETISSKVGRQAMRGRRWARLGERSIDLIFRPWERGHCRKHVEIDELQQAVREEIERIRGELPPG